MSESRSKNISELRRKLGESLNTSAHKRALKAMLDGDSMAPSKSEFLMTAEFYQKEAEDLKAQLKQKNNEIVKLKARNELLEPLAESAKRLQNLKHHKALHGKDKHYMDNKEKSWSDLEFHLHVSVKCEASCGYCAHEGSEALNQLQESGSE